MQIRECWISRELFIALVIILYQVVSGGVASNQFLRYGLTVACKAHGFDLVCPPPKLCTDNGIMIAW